MAALIPDLTFCVNTVTRKTGAGAGGPQLEPEPQSVFPLDHGPLSLPEKWAGLAAIHDVYWKGDKINPYPLPPDKHDFHTWTKWNGNSFDYRLLMRRVGHLVDTDEPFVTQWLRDVTAELAPLVEKQAAKRKRKPGKWEHVWQIIRDENAVQGCGKDQKIANKHNKVCAKRIDDGTCERIDADKVAQIRYEYTHLDRHRKQKHKKRS